MARVRFTRRCLEEDLQRLPKRVVKDALEAARAIERNPELGQTLAPPLDTFRRVRMTGNYRLVYTCETETETWWICMVWARKPGRAGDVYRVLTRLADEGLEYG